MRLSAFWGYLWLGGFAATAFAQPQISIVAPGGTTTVPQGGDIAIELFVNNVTPELLRAYQATLEIVPAPGTVGSITLADTVSPSDQNTSIRVDITRPDWVFTGIFSGVLSATNVGRLQIGATLLTPTDSVEVLSPKYLGDYTLRASPDAVGTFQVRLVLIDPANPNARPTQLVDQNGSQLSLDTFPLGGVTLTAIAIAANDNCANSLAVTDGVTLFSTDNTTTDGPNHPLSQCDVGGNSSIQNDIWFDYTATCTGILAASTCTTATFDTRVAIYDGCTCPVSDVNLLACNDDAVGCGTTSEAVFNGVFQGACYKVRVGGSTNVTGSGSLLMTCIGNDQCSNAEALTAGVSAQGSTRNTPVNDTAAPLCGPPVDSPGVWYSITGTGDLFTASLSSSTFDSRITVYEGTCSSLACVADADNPGGSQETVSWCTSPGVVYFILVHGNVGLTGAFALRVDSASCDDGSVCTQDSCNTNICVNTPLFDDITFCCDPVSSNLIAIDDNNPCTNDTCDAATGLVSHVPVPDAPSAACDDGFPCTFDTCQSGFCTNTDINTLPCVIDADCPGGNTCISNICFCNVAPRLTLVSEPSGSLQVPGCFVVGDIVKIRVDLGPTDVTTLTSADIVGVQFFLSYDATTLNFLDISPGATVDPSSPFALAFNSTTDPVAGTIDYLVGANLGSGTRQPTTVAIITFRATAECSAFVRFRPTGPNGVSNVLTLTGGGRIDPLLDDLNFVQISAAPPLISLCPADIVVQPDPGLVTALVTWQNPTGSNSCDGGPVPVTCNPASGSTFPPNTTTVTCTATDTCGRQASCSFLVTVQTPLLTVDLELSPTMTAGTIDRCITFDLWDCTAVGGPQTTTVEQSVSFTGGSALAVPVPIPGGGWDCLSARDALHTLRSTATDFVTTNGVDYTATFVGPRATGGHQLLGGDLNDDGFIDIVDFAVFFPHYLTPASSSTPCGTLGPHANINGDNVVDLLDLVFISSNSLFASEPACCGLSLASIPVRRTSITLDELRRMGLGDLSPFDRDHNGIFDFEDVAAVLGNAADILKHNGQGRGLGLDKRLRKGARKGR